MENRRYLTEEELAQLDDWEYDVEQDLTEDSEETNAGAGAESTAETSWEPQPGQEVYLDDTRYVIESVGLFDVHLADDTQTYPITRVESKERLPSLARLDERNNPLFEAPALESVPISVEPDVTVEQAEIPESTVALPAENFHITDDHLGEGGPKTKFRRNLDAIRLLKELEQDNRQASAEEQEILSQYVGWGGLADAFDESKTDWASEFQELLRSAYPRGVCRCQSLHAECPLHQPHGDSRRSTMPWNSWAFTPATFWSRPWAWAISSGCCRIPWREAASMAWSWTVFPERIAKPALSQRRHHRGRL